jgi:hypothetical protein
MLCRGIPRRGLGSGGELRRSWAKDRLVCVDATSLSCRAMLGHLGASVFDIKPRHSQLYRNTI